MWLISLQYKNLGALGTTSFPVQLDLQDPQFALLEAVNQRDLPVVLVSGKNGSGKTTLCAGIYFALRGSGILNGRSIPKGIMTEGTRELTVALTVRHSGQVKKFSNKGYELRKDRITLVRSAVARQDGNDYTYYIIDGHHNIFDAVPMGAKVSSETYQRVLESMGINEGVIRAYEETLEQGSISKLASAASKDQSQLFDLLCRVAGAANARKDYELKRRRTRDDLLQLQKEVRSLSDKRTELDRMRRKKADYTRLLALQAEQKEQREKYDDWRVYGYAAQVELNDLRIAGIERQLREKEKDIDLLRQASFERLALLSATEQEHQQMKANQSELERKIGQAQISLGQNQTLYQISKEVVDSTPAEAVAKTIAEWNAELDLLRDLATTASQRVRALQADIAANEQQIQALLDKTSLNRFPDFVREFSKRLESHGIEHHLLADVLNIKDREWQAAIENYLGNSRFWVMVAGGKKDFDEAYRYVEDLRYRPGIRGPRARPNRNESVYRGTVWELLDLPDKDLELWGGHLDGLGYQLVARTAEEARALSIARPGLDIFSATGMASRPDIYARSVMLFQDKIGALYCGKRAIEIELERLRNDALRIQHEHRTSGMDAQKAREQASTCEQLRNHCDAFHKATEKLAVAEAGLIIAEQKLSEVSEEKKGFDQLFEQKRNELEEKRVRKADDDRNLEVLKQDQSSLQKQRSGYMAQIPAALNVSAKTLEEAKKRLASTLVEVPQEEQRALKLEAIAREAREESSKAEEEMRVITRSIQDIPDSEILDATIPPKCDALEIVCKQVELALEQKRTIFKTSLRAAESEYMLLHQEMVQATAMVERQANQISGPLQVDFRIRLKMPEGEIFKVSEDDLDALEILNSLDNQEMAVEVRVRFSKDLRKDYRAISDSWASGGQREIACTALLGGILFAAQQMHAQGEISGSSWEKAPILMLDEPFGNLDLVNKSTLIGSLLLLPVQIIVLYPAPPMEFIQAADVVIAVVQSSGADNPTVLRLSRGIRTQSRADLAAIYRGETTNELAV
jgi:chromosome segregation ATPase